MFAGHFYVSRFEFNLPPIELDREGTLRKIAKAEGYGVLLARTAPRR